MSTNKTPNNYDLDLMFRPIMAEEFAKHIHATIPNKDDKNDDNLDDIMFKPIMAGDFEKLVNSMQNDDEPAAKVKYNPKKRRLI